MTGGNAQRGEECCSTWFSFAAEVLALLPVGEQLDLHSAPCACVPGLQVRLWLAPLQGVGIGEWKRDGAQTDFVLGCNWRGA